MTPSSILPPEYLLPLNSGLVTAEAGAVIGRQPLTETREHFLEAGVRLANAYIMGTDGRPEAKPDFFDLLPGLQLKQVCHQATEITLQHRMEEDGAAAEQQTRVRPYTAGAFYKLFSPPQRSGIARRGAILQGYKMEVAQQLVTNAAYPPLGTAEIGLHIPTEFAVRAENPGYIFAGSLALHSANPTLGALTSQVRKVIDEDISRMTRLTEGELAAQQRRPIAGVSTEHMGIMLADLLRGTVLSHRKQRAAVDSAQERATRLASRIRLTEVAAYAILRSLSEA